MPCRADHGRTLALTDLFRAPILFWLETTPEGQAALRTVRLSRAGAKA
jgi:hypothetical protein